MPDFYFLLKGVKKKQKDHFFKQSVIWPLKGSRSLADARVIEDVAKVQQNWRTRLQALYDHKWHDLQNPGNLQFARNCPPTVVITQSNKLLRPCNMWHICPWCFCRKNEALYDLLASFLPNRGSFKESRFSLLEIQNSRTMTKVEAGANLDALLQIWRKSPHNLCKRINALGSHFNILLSQTDVNGRRSGYKLTYRILAMVPVNYEIPAFLYDQDRKIRITEMTNKKQLVGILARTCRYPIGLMQGDIEMTIISLNARRNMRSSALFGCFRANKRKLNDPNSPGDPSANG